MKQLAGVVAKGDFEHVGDELIVNWPAGETTTLGPDEFVTQYDAKDTDSPVAADGGFVVALDCRITEELRAEGAARELIRNIQDLRKQQDYKITDRIEVRFDGEIASEWVDFVLGETLGRLAEVAEPDAECEVKLGDGVTVGVAIRKSV